MIPILARARIKGSRSRKVESSCISGLSNSPLSSGITRESKAQGVFNRDSDNLDEELKSLWCLEGKGPTSFWGLSGSRGAYSRARRIGPIRHSVSDGSCTTPHGCPEWSVRT